MRPVRGLGALLLLGLPACVQLTFESRWVEQPPPPEVVQHLQPGHDDLTSCLLHLGAPHYVWEYAGDGMALGWVYSDASSWGVSASYSFSDYSSLSFDFDSGSLQLPGVVLWFGPDLQLQRWRQGKLADLTTSLRLRSAPVDLDQEH